MTINPVLYEKAVLKLPTATVEFRGPYHEKPYNS